MVDIYLTEKGILVSNLFIGGIVGVKYILFEIYGCQSAGSLHLTFPSFPVLSF
jgi:hypothetical protein